jgi:hypothetical protein
MITKNKSASLSPRKGYFCPEYESEGKITVAQRRQLTEAIMSNWNNSDEEKEEKVALLEELTASEADDYLAEITHWR